MKILFVTVTIDSILGGGTATRTLELAKSISKMKKYECSIVTTIPINFPSEYEKSSINFFFLGVLFKRYYVPNIRPILLYKFVKSFDQVHFISHWSLINPILYFFVRINNKHYTYTPAGTLPIFGRSKIIKKVYDILFGKSLVKNADFCIAVTKKEKIDFSRFLVPDSKIIIIPNGVNSLDRAEHSAIAARSDIHDHPLQKHEYILFLGRLNSIKGPDILLEAFVTLSKINKDIHLVFAGPDEGMGSVLRSRIASATLSNRVHLIGHVAGHLKTSLIMSSRFLVVPSRYEAMSIVALEAGICSKPVILSSACGFDVVSEFGCPVVDPVPDLLADAMLFLLSSEVDCDFIGSNLRDHILKTYTWETAAKKYISLI